MFCFKLAHMATGVAVGRALPVLSASSASQARERENTAHCLLDLVSRNQDEWCRDTAACQVYSAFLVNRLHTSHWS